ncbi:MAG: SDR family NAD(P)-dependent oxidoreductase, partial [Candidatus Brocadia sp.]|nr:SDR family NAD(P)-dependent oxidoreductase [Candidatus Brocadia sp.]
MRRLEGKNALITGATSGIGYAIAVRFSQEGANVAINYRQDDEKVEDVLSTVRNICLSVKGFGCKDLVVQGDVSKEDDVV